MKTFSQCVCLACVCLVCGCRNADEGVKVILGGTIVDRSGKPAIPDAVIVVEGKTIRAAGPRAMVPVPQNSERVNAAGEFVAPIQPDGEVAAGKPADLLILRSPGNIDRRMEQGRWTTPAR